jgi:hypothetical protein
MFGRGLLPLARSNTVIIASNKHKYKLMNNKPIESSPTSKKLSFQSFYKN